MKNPSVLVLKTEGTNCDEETRFAFELAGGTAEIVHINELRNKEKSLKNYQILAIPGGFSYGDDVVSGKILAIELTSFFSEELKTFTKRKDTLTIGICNGFQVLVRTGLLPFNTLGNMKVTLTNNDSAHFECRWIKMKVEEQTKCVFLKNLKNRELSLQVAHGEGKFYTDISTLKQIEQQHLVGMRYTNGRGKPTQEYPQNPNGSLHAIAGICDISGRIFGLMPHPERFVRIEQYPNWRREEIEKPHGLPIFENMIAFAKNS